MKSDKAVPAVRGVVARTSAPQRAALLMKRHFIAALAALAVTSCASDAPSSIPASGPIPERDSGTGYKTPDEALVGLRQKPGVKIYEHNGWTVAQDDADRAVWSFTPANHPAHPAVVKRYAYEEGGSVWVRMGVICGASKEACDALVREFKALTDRTAKEMQQSTK